MDIYKHKTFAKWLKKEKITDQQLHQVVIEMDNGLFEANLGQGLFKKRVAREGFGKRTSYRVLLIFKQHDKAIFTFGFAKRELDNIGSEQLSQLRILAKHYLSLNKTKIKKLVTKGELVEVNTP